MKILLDANVVIAALMGSRATITIITSKNHQLYVPRKIVEEIKKYKIRICLATYCFTDIKTSTISTTAFSLEM